MAKKKQIQVKPNEELSVRDIQSLAKKVESWEVTSLSRYSGSGHVEVEGYGREISHVFYDAQSGDVWIRSSFDESLGYEVEVGFSRGASELGYHFDGFDLGLARRVYEIAESKYEADNP